MTEWNIPQNVDELFASAPASYSIIDPDCSGDNVYAMRLFIDSIAGLEDYVVTDDGTQVECVKDGKTIFIDAGGLGDFHMHGYDVSLPNTEIKTEPLTP